ncbi:MAG: cytochrome c family protein [Hyphomicrobiales bacterium]|uniref:c-type cytochrome n=1 Tax=Rhabdaerophilum calidifontis TaxID=2604328 RepID=UPI00123C60EB|nr:cytochrome c family protein [Rhabdaerophilum calidifontis]MCA1953026.1 cytochrome c family protein [Hyphomicrobiales bacterium]MCA1999679.1 cytochrome c family protein [Hyphomicrobiales bacterium]
MLRFSIAAATIALAAAAQAQDAEAGKAVFGQCRACHQVGETAKNGVGPLLNGIIGRKAGTVEGYNYSEANKNSGKTWDEATFLAYIKDPRGFMPGNKMAYAGLKDEKRAADLLAYLKTFGPDGKPKQ